MRTHAKVCSMGREPVLNKTDIEMRCEARHDAHVASGSDGGAVNGRNKGGRHPLLSALTLLAEFSSSLCSLSLLPSDIIIIYFPSNTILNKLRAL
jgi:hypothetical protein